MNINLKGVLLSVPETTLDVPSLKRMWIHEVLRVYHDRLIDDKDRSWLYETLQDVTNSQLGENFHKLLQRLDVDNDNIVTYQFYPLNTLCRENYCFSFAFNNTHALVFQRFLS